MRCSIRAALLTALLAVAGCNHDVTSDQSDARATHRDASRLDASASADDSGTVDAGETQDVGSPDVASGVDAGAPATCSDQSQDGDESDLDCGGSCARCKLGQKCNGVADCESGVCVAGLCAACASAQDCGADEACRSRTCTSGACGFSPVAQGTACGTGMTCDGAGSCSGCAVASDCPGQDSECATRTCVGGTCGQDFAPAGKALANQIAGNCHLSVCDGAGGTRSLADDKNLPVDGNPCTDDLCSDGVASNPPIPAGMACGDQQKCDGKGKCVGCLIPRDCPGVDGECQTRTCKDGACGTDFTASGTALKTQTPFDCHELQCDGSGGTVDAVADTDLPVDDNPCTRDLCQAGNPSNPPMPAGSQCGTGIICDGNGKCVSCVAPTDCPGQDSECQVRSCEQAQCGLKNTASGIALSQQAAGDCHTVRCDGRGGTTNAADDTDLPVDNNPCTDDLCSAGAASNPNKAQGAGCGAGLICDGKGVCVGCVNGTDCAGQDSDCQVRTCSAGACGLKNTPVGTAVSQQVAGDCHTVRCDGKGGSTNAVDDTDLPDDKNPCTRDVCSSGVTSNPPSAAGTSCGVGQICDGAGNCVHCLQPSDCPGQDTECKTRTCTSGVCGFNNAGAGKLLSSQTPGDCHQKICDGSGGTVDQIDNTDLPADDKNQCTDEVCTAGVPSHPNKAPGSPCSQGGGTVCNGLGACVQCVVATTCPGQDTECQTRACYSGSCGFSYASSGTALAAQTPGDCQKKVCDGTGGTTSVADNSDVPADDGKQCTGEVCVAGVPSHPPASAGTACSQGGGIKCDGNGSCVACLAPADCGADTACRLRTCTLGACGINNLGSGTVVSNPVAGDCRSDQCDGSGNVVTGMPDATDLPVDGKQCTQDVCSAGTPSNPLVAAGTACSQSGGIKCDGSGNCVACLAPADCGADTACKLRTCTLGVCGINNLAAGTVVANPTPGDCRSNQCDGNGNVVTNAVDNTDVPVDGKQCTQDVCSAGVPSNPPVAAGTACSQGGGIKCDGSGKCVACLAPADCGSNSACRTWSCTVGACSANNAASGTVVANPTVGDCHSDQCDGSGNVVSNAMDNSDVPVDGKQCTQDLCTAGTPSNPPVAAGTACSQGGGTKCDGSGNCVQCLLASDCGVNTACKTFTCTAGTCGSNNIPAGTVVANPTVGDCRSNQCDGSGNIVVNAVDNTDLPADDGNQCTGEICNAGAPSHPAAPSGSACNQNGGVVCDGAGSCVTCTNGSQCPAGSECQVPVCNAGSCGFIAAPAGPLSSQTPGDCQQRQCDGVQQVAISVADNSDVPADDGNQCTQEVCVAGVPGHPNSPVSTACTQSGGTLCDGNGACVNPPQVASTFPADGATALASTSIAVTFNAAMSPATLTGQTSAGACSGSIQVSLDNFTACVSFSAAAATMSGGNTVATLTPAPGLLVNRTYKIRVTSAAQGATGLALGTPFTQPTGFTTTGPVSCSGGVVISQVFGGGGGTTPVPPYKNDFLELHNRGSTAVNLTGWSVQYASAAGSSWSVTNLSGTIQPGAYLLVQESGGTAGASLPTPDVTGSISMSATAGKVALVSSTTALSGTCPSGGALVDMLGYGAASCSEGAPTPVLTSLVSATRALGGCQDTNVNNVDFMVVTPVPHNSASPIWACACSMNESGNALEADYCDTQFPLSLSVQTGVSTGNIYGRIYEAGMTEAAGANASIVAQLGWGPASANPEYQSGWTWTNASYNVQAGNNDEYLASFTAPAAGTYRYVFRFSLDNGTSWTYCDNNQGDGGAGSNSGLTFDLENEAILTVTP